MPDETIRRLRRACRSGQVDLDRWVREALRHGTVSQERMSAAYYLGAAPLERLLAEGTWAPVRMPTSACAEAIGRHIPLEAVAGQVDVGDALRRGMREAARHSLGCTFGAIRDPVCRTAYTETVIVTRVYEPDAMPRLALALLRLLPRSRRARQICDALQAWIAAPNSGSHEYRLRVQCERVRIPKYPKGLYWVRRLPDGMMTTLTELLTNPKHSSSDHWRDFVCDMKHRIERVERIGCAEQRCLEAIRTELVPWLLGLGDPLLEQRVA